MEEKTLKDEVSELKELLMQGDLEVKKKKDKKFKLPFKSKVGRAKLKKGFVIVEVITENRGIDFVREPIVDGTIKLGETVHALKEDDIYIYKNKPFIHIAKNKINPYNPLEGRNETYGQKYVMARLKNDQISTKKKMGWGIIVIGLIAAVAIGYFVIKGGI